MDGKCFNCVENITRFSKDFIKTIISLKFIFNILRNYLNFTWIGNEKGLQIQLRRLANTIH